MHYSPSLARTFYGFLILCLLMGPLSADAQESQGAFLDVGLLVFDPGIPADKAARSRLGIFPEIRKSEAKYMPVILRDVLMQQAGWGAVRVLPELMDSPELLVTGEILHSDGQQLSLQIRAQDAAGVLWLDAVYEGLATPTDYTGSPQSDPFLQVYENIAADLQQVRERLGAARTSTIREIALLRYAAALAPEVFGDYLVVGESGEYVLQRLPARGDPMLERIIRLREQEYRFIDTVDEQYVNLSDAIAPAYLLWREYSAEQAVFVDDFEDRVLGRKSRARPGSFAALEQTYNTYRLSRIHAQDLDELALGFNNEVLPTSLEISGTVYKLSGTLENQYGEWRDILQQIFALETGLTPSP
ncbi:MAG: hypothetical protein P8M21_03750 [Halioglobus sp.]|nr:hypothetical protein [Halioglobus sp.]